MPSIKRWFSVKVEKTYLSGAKATKPPACSLRVIKLLLRKRPANCHFLCTLFTGFKHDNNCFRDLFKDLGVADCLCSVGSSNYSFCQKQFRKELFLLRENVVKSQ